ncbi:DNA-binding protein [Pseudomonas sp. G5(2012)]|uniref:DNA-binding protein n=1 Tax=Pseudomonas sp. G5(2012) TaxID=1268068 RepID=UPI000343294F|nr:DNA-binding protein [Pseudomonas sp. G5(2012)]EPA99380.1 hypothetical protein PG5_01870 [Pseudomonas sp. G5(2012)]
MARGGINKALVLKARTALVARGKRPSIDAVRIELGNTGSKTTISRYLKEIAMVPAASSLTVQERLRAPILELVEQLVDELKEEADATIKSSLEDLSLKKDQLQTNLIAEHSALELSESRRAAAEASLTELQANLQRIEEKLIKAVTREFELAGKVKEQAAQLIEKDAQIVSLHQTHEQTRHSLELFHEASKSQRDQLFSTHEQQLKHLNAELHGLHLERLTKQDELIRLNRDNERLLQEQQSLLKTSQHQEKQLRRVQEQHQVLHIAYQQLMQAEACATADLAATHQTLLDATDAGESAHTENQILEVRVHRFNQPIEKAPADAQPSLQKEGDVEERGRDDAS